MENIKEKETSVSLGANDEYQYKDIQITSHEELVAEVKRMRRMLWQLKQNHSRSITGRESDKLFGQLQQIQKENKESNSKKIRFHRYLAISNIVHIVLSSFSFVIAPVFFFIVFPFNRAYWHQYGFVDMAPLAFLTIIGTLLFGLFSLYPIKKKHYIFTAILNAIISAIGLAGFIYTITEYNVTLLDEQALVFISAMMLTVPFSIAVTVLALITHIVSRSKKGE